MFIKAKQHQPKNIWSMIHNSPQIPFIYLTFNTSTIIINKYARWF